METLSENQEYKDLKNQEYEDLKKEIIFDNMQPAPWGKRLLNLIIDTIVYYVLVTIWFVGMGFFGVVDMESPDNDAVLQLLGILVMYLYYVVFESFTGKTVGKMVTGTRVIRYDGDKPTFVNILGRSLCRLVPLDAFSFLSSNPIGWHDSWSGTRVVNDIELYRLREEREKQENQEGTY